MWCGNTTKILTYLQLQSYQADFIGSATQKKEKKLIWSFNFTFSYIVNILSLYNSTCIGGCVVLPYTGAWEILLYNDIKTS